MYLLAVVITGYLNIFSLYFKKRATGLYHFWGHIFLYLLLPVVSVDEDKEVIGNLKVSLEAAKALTGIYQEFHQKSDTKEEDEIEEEEEEEEEPKKELKKDPIELLDCEDDSDL